MKVTALDRPMWSQVSWVLEGCLINNSNAGDGPSQVELYMF